MNSWRYEMFVNIMNSLSISILVFDESEFRAAKTKHYQLFVSIFFILEFTFIGKKLKSLFFLINLLVVICYFMFSEFLEITHSDISSTNQFEQNTTVLNTTIIDSKTQKILAHNLYINIIEILLNFKMIRIFSLMYHQKKFRIIFKTIEKVGDTLLGLLYTLLSFFIIFSNFSMLLIGGNIKKDSFINSTSIPSYYFQINFNDLPNGFFTCFCLTMVNNMNIIVEALSSGSTFFTFYFNSFYFISYVLILNLCHTVILDMFININNILKTVKKQKLKKSTQNSKVGKFEEDIVGSSDLSEGNEQQLSKNAEIELEHKRDTSKKGFEERLFVKQKQKPVKKIKRFESLVADNEAEEAPISKKKFKHLHPLHKKSFSEARNTIFEKTKDNDEA